MKTYQVPVTEFREVQIVYLVDANDPDEAYDKAQKGDVVGVSHKLSEEITRCDPDKDTKNYKVVTNVHEQFCLNTKGIAAKRVK